MRPPSPLGLPKRSLEHPFRCVNVYDMSIGDGVVTDIYAEDGLPKEFSHNLVIKNTFVEAVDDVETSGFGICSAPELHGRNSLHFAEARQLDDGDSDMDGVPHRQFYGRFNTERGNVDNAIRIQCCIRRYFARRRAEKFRFQKKFCYLEKLLLNGLQQALQSCLETSERGKSDFLCTSPCGAAGPAGD